MLTFFKGRLAIDFTQKFASEIFKWCWRCRVRYKTDAGKLLLGPKGQRHATVWDKSSLLQRNEPRRVRGTNTGSSVLHRLVGQRKLCQVVPNHLRLQGNGKLRECVRQSSWSMTAGKHKLTNLDFDLVENTTIVDANDTADHLWHDDHVAQMRADRLGLLTLKCLLLLHCLNAMRGKLNANEQAGFRTAEKDTQ